MAKRLLAQLPPPTGCWVPEFRHYHYHDARRFHEQHPDSVLQLGALHAELFRASGKRDRLRLGWPRRVDFSNAVLFTFYRLTNSAIYSRGIANDPIGISIASNKTMHIFGVPGQVNASFTRQSADGGATTELRAGGGITPCLCYLSPASLTVGQRKEDVSAYL